MCTNILINEGYDLTGENEITTEVLTLEQLNANMISKFNQQLLQIDKNRQITEEQILVLDSKFVNWQTIIDYIESLNLDVKISPEILRELNDKFANIESGTIRNNCEILYNILNIFELWRDTSIISITFIANINMVKEQLYRFWKSNWNSPDVLHKCAWYGSRLGEYKTREEIAKKKKIIDTFNNDKKRITNQIALFSNNEFLKDKTSDPCIICFEDLSDVVITQCRHIFCLECTKRMSNELKSNFTCPECRTPLTCNSLNITNVAIINKEICKSKSEEEKELEKKGLGLGSSSGMSLSLVDISKLSPIEQKLGVDWKNKCINKYGSKMAVLVEYLYKLFETKENRVIIFSQYEKMLRMISTTLAEFNIKFVYCCGNNYVLNRNINKFKTDDSYRVIMLSSENSNSGTTLVEANYVIMCDVLYDNIEKVKAMESQAIGRAVRLGQKLPVKIVRFITTNTVESVYYTKTKYDINILQN